MLVQVSDLKAPVMESGLDYASYQLGSVRMGRT